MIASNTVIIIQCLCSSEGNGQFADKPTCGQSSRWLVNSPKCL